MGHPAEPETTRVGEFESNVSAPVVIVRIYPRSEADPIRILEFAKLIGAGGYFRWIAHFCMTVNLDRQIYKFEVQFLSEEERERYTTKAARKEHMLRMQGKTSQESWEAFTRGETE